MNPRNGNFGRGLGDWFAYRELLERWLESGSLEALDFEVRPSPRSNGQQRVAVVAGGGGGIGARRSNATLESDRAVAWGEVGLLRNSRWPAFFFCESNRAITLSSPHCIAALEHGLPDEIPTTWLGQVTEHVPGGEQAGKRGIHHLFNAQLAA